MDFTGAIFSPFPIASLTKAATFLSMFLFYFLPHLARGAGTSNFLPYLLHIANERFRLCIHTFSIAHF